MSRRPRPVGECHLCGVVGPLSFEHVPPEAAYNNRGVLRVTLEELMRTTLEGQPRGKVQQRGAGAYTLCGRCNNNTGAWYGADFVEFCRLAMAVLQASGGRPTSIPVTRVRPLRILKQIIAMFHSLCGPGFGGGGVLRRFVLDKGRTGLPAAFRVFVYFAVGPRVRYAPLMVSASVRGPRDLRVMSEIAFPPLGYLLAMDSPPPDGRLAEITHFARCGYDEVKSWEVRLPVLPTVTSESGDYRTPQEVAEAGRRNARIRPRPGRGLDQPPPSAG